MLTAKSSKRVLNRKPESKDGKKSQIKSKSTAASPTTVDLRGVQIHFPFKPYQCQEAYMGKVLDALNNAENALLESPTGTGKTLCLLCSTLAWQQEQSRMLSDQSMGYTAGASMDANAPDAQQASEQPKVNKSTIIYASRTHSQLSQVVKEMRFTRYRPKHAVLGSREQMCVHPKVKTAKATSFDINHNCTKLNKERKCRFRNNLEGFVVDTCGGDGTKSKSEGSSFEFGMQPVLDMEELVDLGKKRKVCPFYMTRGQVADAEIIFVPYNYLFDKDARSSTLADVKWENAILVFDEAHNLESFASESASFDLSSVDIAGCVNEVNRAIGYLQAMPEMGEASNVKMDNLIRLKSIFLEFEQYLDTQIAGAGGSFTGDYIFEIFAKGVNLNYSNHGIFLKFVRQVSDMVMDMKGGGSGKSSAACPKLDHFVGCVKRVFGTATEGQSFAKARAYRVHVSPKSGNASNKGRAPSSSGGGFVGSSNAASKNSNGRVLSYWCFAPSLAMHELAALNVRSILVTSGTLSPLPSYSLELGLPFPHTLENSHIIGKDQISVRVIGKGVSGKALTSTYNRRSDMEYILELGNTIISLARIIPAGILIFFPSYGVMEQCIEKWGGPLSSRSKSQSYGKNNFFNARQKRTNSTSTGTGRFSFPHTTLAHTQSKSATPWQRLMAVKSIVLEPKTTSELKDVIDEFDKFISAPKSKGCIMMGVCRGKISEGIDFSDDKCRAVLITGLPFAPYLDPKVKLKREYLDGTKAAITVKPTGDGGFGGGSGSTSTLALSGAEWYSQQAHRAVNQAIGRVIRHRSDYGAILFLDSRFSEERNQQGVSKWIQPSFEPDTGVGGAIQALAKFYRGAKAKADANKTMLEKGQHSVQGLQLKYEADPPSSKPIDSIQKITKIAFIKKTGGESVSSNTATENEELLEGYVPPNRITKHVKLDEPYIPTAKANIPMKVENNIYSNSKGLASLYDKSSKGISVQKVSTVKGDKLSDTINSAWASLGKSSSASHLKQRAQSSNSKEKNKKLAQQFFKLAKSTLTSGDFIMLRKMLVSLKDLGNKKEKSIYMARAKKLIHLLLQYDDPQPPDRSIGDTMVELLHSLIPAVYRFEMLITACKLRFEKSDFYQLSSESLPPTDFNFLIEVFPSLMIDYEKWKDEIKAKSNDRHLFNNLREIISILIKNRIAQNKDLLISMKTLLSMKMRNMATTLMNELRTKQKMITMKDRDRKRYGEENINRALFMKPERSLAMMPTKKNDTVRHEDFIGESQALPHLEGKERSISKETAVIKKSSRAGVHELKNLNPYLVKKRSPLDQMRKEEVSSKVTARPSKRARSIMETVKTTPKREHTDANQTKEEENSKGLDPLDKLLQQAKAEIYKKATPKIVRINRLLKSNAPNGTLCNICDATSSSFLMAECNHFSCLDCWVKWLRRSQTCPTCRKPTTKESLSRVVFEGVDTPSLTQIMNGQEGEEEEESGSDHDELEIC